MKKYITGTITEMFNDHKGFFFFFCGNNFNLVLRHFIAFYYNTFDIVLFLVPFKLLLY